MVKLTKIIYDTNTTPKKCVVVSIRKFLTMVFNAHLNTTK